MDRLKEHELTTQAFNTQIAKGSTLYKSCKNPEVIRNEIKDRYSPQLFVEIFDFASEYIDVGRSGSDVQKWCKSKIPRTSVNTSSVADRRQSCSLSSQAAPN